MNILLISSYLPYPLYSGGHIRLFNLIKELSKKHRITLVCEKRAYQTEKDIMEVARYCDTVHTVHRNKQWSLKNIIKTGFSFKPFLLVGHDHNDMKKKIKELLEKKKFDVIHVETFYVLQNVPETEIPIILVEHNIEYSVYKRYADQAKIFLRPFFYIDVKKLEIAEKKSWNRVHKVIAVSEIEKKKIGIDGVEVVPNGVDLGLFTFRKPLEKSYHSVAKQAHMPEKELLFIGDFSWIQNRDAVKWIINDIWPYLLRAVEGEIKIKFHIAGRQIPSEIRSLSTYDSIIYTENSPNTVELFKNADVLLAPIRVGGGTSYKILEAMATGVPVVTTSLGIEGLQAKPDVHAICADETQALVEKTARLLRDTTLYENVGKNARKLIEEKYNWKVIAKKLEEVYEAIK